MRTENTRKMYVIVQQARGYPQQFTFCGTRYHLDDAKARASELRSLDPDMIVNIWEVHKTHIYS